MRILIAPDKFKGSLTALQVCEIIRSTILENHPEHKVDTIPLSDGGEGTCDQLTRYSKGKSVSLAVFDPLMREIESSYGISADGKTAFVEMAKASGLQLLKPKERNCSTTSTYGTGQLIAHALSNGASELVLAVGGSATNDAGLGMARALGYQLLSNDGPLLGIGNDLIKLKQIDRKGIHREIQRTKFIVLCDVDNPLYGNHGAAYVFAKQKGATDDEIKLLDMGLRNFAAIANNMNCDINFPGAGAAGGLGAGAKLFLNARIQRGIDFVTGFTSLEEKIIDADIIITGEGKIDQQTLSGKVVSGVAALARKHKRRLITISGALELNGDQLRELGVSQAVTLTDQHTDEKSAIQNAEIIMRQKVREIKI